MFERRPVWGLILVLNVCIVIWRISVQEPAMLEAEAMSSSVAALSASNSFVENVSTGKQQQQQQQHNAPVVRTVRSGFVAADVQQLQYAGKHLLAQRAEAHENMAKVIQRSAVSSEPTTSNEWSSFGVGMKSQKPLNSSSSSGSSSVVRSYSDKFSSKQNNEYTKFTVSSTSAPLVTVATLRNMGELQPPSTRIPAISTVAETLPPHDAAQLINLHNFTYLMNQPRCSGQIDAVILVHSAPGNREKRMIIRETWGALEKLPKWEGVMPLRVVFLLGAVRTIALQRELKQENEKFGDIVQGSFVDDYRNMTYKHVMAFKWFLYNCAHAQILMKVDDDVYVNTPQLLMYWRNQRLNQKTANSAIINAYNNNNNNSSRDLNNTTNANTDEFNDVNYSNNDIANINFNHSSYLQFNASRELFRHPQNLLFCEANIGAKVKRTYRSKWRVAPEEYAGRYYPPYCPGYAIIYSPDVVWRLYRAAQRAKYFWIDDVQITGVLAQKLNINITPSQAYILYENVCQRLLQQQLHSRDIRFVYAWHLVKPQEMRALWTLYLRLAEQQFAANANNSTRAVLNYAQDKRVS